MNEDYFDMDNACNIPKILGEFVDISKKLHE